MNLIADVARKNPEVYAAPVSPGEIAGAIRRARNHGWHISGPDRDGSYVTLEPPFVDERVGGISVTPAVVRLPDATFLFELLREAHPFVQVVTGGAREARPAGPARAPDLYLVDP